MHTKRLMHGQLGLVLPAHDPIRLAEEIAIADHMLQGRLFVGMARGYQARWQNVLCQRFGVTSTASDAGDADQRNRLLFSENFKIMKKAWAEDLLTLRRARPTRCPYPYDAGIPNWPPAKTITGPYGVPGEVDDNGTMRGHGRRAEALHVTAPAALPGVRRQPRHAAVVRRGERHADDPHGADRQILKQLMEIYQEGAATAGRNPRVRRGHRRRAGRSTSTRTARARTPSTRRSRERAQVRGAGLARLVPSSSASWRARGCSARRAPCPGPDEHLADRLTNSGLLIGGTVDDVKRQVESFLQELPIDYFVWLFHWGMIPREEGLPMLELFATEIMPEFGMDASSLEAAAAGA